MKKNLVITVLLAVFSIQGSFSQDIYAVLDGNIYKYNECEETLFFDNEIFFPTDSIFHAQWQPPTYTYFKHKMTIWDEEIEDSVECSLSSAYPFEIIDSNRVMIPIEGTYNSDTKTGYYIAIIDVTNYSVEKILKVMESSQSNLWVGFVKLPDNTYYGGPFLLDENLTTVTTDYNNSLYLSNYDWGKITVFGNRWAFNSSSINAYGAKVGILNKVTGQLVSFAETTPGLNYDYFGVSRLFKVDENTSISLVRNPPSTSYYVVKYNYSNFEGEIIDSIVPGTEDYKKFGNGSWNVFYYVGNNNFIVISNYGGAEMAGTVSIYNTDSKTTTVIKDFTNVDEIPSSYLFGSLTFRGQFFCANKFISSRQHIYNFDGAEIDITVCHDFLGNNSLKNQKCYNCLDYWDYENQLSIANESKTNQIKTYPNPTNDKINIEGILNPSNVIISNLMGQVMYNENANSKEITIDVSSFNNGLYFVEIQDGKGNKYNSKFVVNR